MKHFFHFVLTIALLLISVFVVYYYWTVKSVEDLKELPSILLSAVIIYLAIQLLKRYVKRRVSWYDWLYYVGLSAILLPLFLFTSTADWLFDITKYGSLFMLAPPLLETIELIKGRNDNEE